MSSLMTPVESLQLQIQANDRDICLIRLHFYTATQFMHSTGIDPTWRDLLRACANLRAVYSSGPFINHLQAIPILDEMKAIYEQRTGLCGP